MDNDNNKKMFKNMMKMRRSRSSNVRVLLSPTLTLLPIIIAICVCLCVHCDSATLPPPQPPLQSTTISPALLESVVFGSVAVATTPTTTTVAPTTTTELMYIPTGTPAQIRVELCREGCFKMFFSNGVPCDRSRECLACWSECRKPRHSSSYKRKPTWYLTTWSISVESMVQQDSLVLVEVTWNSLDFPNQCLVTWEVAGGGLMGNLLTESTNVQLSLWPETKYRVQVTCKNKDTGDMARSKPLIVDTAKAIEPLNSNNTNNNNDNNKANNNLLRHDSAVSSDENNGKNAGNGNDDGVGVSDGDGDGDGKNKDTTDGAVNNKVDKDEQVGATVKTDIDNQVAITEQSEAEQEQEHFPAQDIAPILPYDDDDGNDSNDDIDAATIVGGGNENGVDDNQHLIGINHHHQSVEQLRKHTNFVFNWQTPNRQNKVDKKFSAIGSNGNNENSYSNTADDLPLSTPLRKHDELNMLSILSTTADLQKPVLFGLMAGTLLLMAFMLLMCLLCRVRRAPDDKAALLRDEAAETTLDEDDEDDSMYKSVVILPPALAIIAADNSKADRLAQMQKAAAALKV